MYLIHLLYYRTRYTFTVTARSSFSSPLDLVGSATVTVELLDANDNPPVFTPSAFTFSVLENQSPPTIVGNVTARDADSGTNAMVRT